VRQVG